ncbi:MAG: hypothetical protein KH135_01245 [Firmicutes bacterium]|nr:hypothetical protein [Bacillota bacterium]
MENNEVKNVNSEEKPKKLKKEINVWLGMFIVLCVGLAIVGGIYFYCKNNEPKDNDDKKVTETKKPEKTTTPTKTPENEVKDENLAVTDTLVQKLYSYVDNKDLEIFKIIQSKIERGKTTKVTAESLTAKEKNLLAYKQIPAFSIQQKYCGNYAGMITYNTTDSTINYWVCGNAASGGSTPIDEAIKKYDDRNNQTSSFNENLLKEKVEEIFGSGMYQRTEFPLDMYSKYVYDNHSGDYVMQYCLACGGTGGARGNSILTSALKTKENIQITEQITCTKANYCEKDYQIFIRHVFKNVNGNYYYDYSELAN